MKRLTKPILFLSWLFTFLYLYNYESINVKLATHAGLSFIWKYKRACKIVKNGNKVTFEKTARKSLFYPDNCDRTKSSWSPFGNTEFSLEKVDYEIGCKTNPLNKIAIIIPHRHREEHLEIITRKLHTILQIQRQIYNIFVVHQLGEDTFNRALLINIGVVEAKKYGYKCFVAHDVDMYPEDEENYYFCDSESVRHLSAKMDKFDYNLIYNGYVGGITAFTYSNSRL